MSKYSKILRMLNKNIAGKLIYNFINLKLHVNNKKKQSNVQPL